MSAARRPIVVAIDGPVGVGKSSVARRVAERLGIPYLETGAMYRALAVKVLENGIDPDDRAAVEAMAADLDLRLEVLAHGEIAVLLDGRRLGERLRAPGVADATSRISVIPAVRRRLVELQRGCAGEHGAVVEGRDIGTKVFPDSPFKFFLDAAATVRAERRHLQMRQEGRGEVPLDRVVAELVERDERDRSRRESPLVQAPGSILIDTGALSEDEVVEQVVREVRRRSS